jgi:serine/threonine-protein kinase BUR1
VIIVCQIGLKSSTATTDCLVFIRKLLSSQLSTAMAPTPPKRTATNSPDGARPAKRLATSSPEEGEVDDATPLPQPRSKSPSPVRHATSKPKVAFPFVTKRTNEKNGVVPEIRVKEKEKEKVVPVVYERSEEDERKIREREQRAKLPPRPHHDGLRRTGGGSSTLDHWEPSLDRMPRRSWEYVPHDYERRRERAYPAWDRRDYSSSRSHAARGDRGRSRSSPSPLSRSPPTPSSSHHGKHRLPVHRTPEFNFSPPRRDYNVDRIRDQERDRSLVWDRPEDDRAYRPDDDRSYRPIDDADRMYRPNDDRHHPSRNWPSECHREPMDEQDRYYRPTTREQHYDDNWSRYPQDSRNADNPPDTYHHSLPDTSLPPRPQTPPSPAAPPPPFSPPPPPPDVLEKDETLPAEHAAVSISLPLKRPAAPRDPHSPAPLPLPVAKEVSRRKKEELKSDEKEKGHRRVATRNRKREPVHRSREEEEKIYGRKFVGCGRQSDYEVTTKLGEGTFGYVL